MRTSPVIFCCNLISQSVSVYFLNWINFSVVAAEFWMRYQCQNRASHKILESINMKITFPWRITKLQVDLVIQNVVWIWLTWISNKKVNKPKEEIRNLWNLLFIYCLIGWRLRDYGKQYLTLHGMIWGTPIENKQNIILWFLVDVLNFLKSLLFLPL